MYWYALSLLYEVINRPTLVVNLSVTDTSYALYNEAIYHIYQTVTSYFRAIYRAKVFK